jgi:hypothetical protein
VPSNGACAPEGEAPATSVERLRARIDSRSGGTAASASDWRSASSGSPAGRSTANVALSQHPITQQRSDLRGDGITLIGDGLFADGEGVGESNGQLTRAGIAGRLDRALNEREMGGAVRL